MIIKTTLATLALAASTTMCAGNGKTQEPTIRHAAVITFCGSGRMSDGELPTYNAAWYTPAKRGESLSLSGPDFQSLQLTAHGHSKYGESVIEIWDGPICKNPPTVHLGVYEVTNYHQ
jgi:hypothetical protein